MSLSRSRGFSSAGHEDTPRVYVVDDHREMCASIEALLATRGYRVQCFQDPLSFIDCAGALDAGVVLLDIRMPGMGGLEVLNAIRSHLRRLSVIMVTGHGEIEDAVRAIKAGAQDFIQKPFKSDLILSVLEKEWANLKSNADNTNDTAALSQLTPRERDVVLALARGRPNKVIAHNLGISVRTVEMHRARAMSRLGCRSLADLLRTVLVHSASDLRVDRGICAAK